MPVDFIVLECLKEIDMQIYNTSIFNSFFLWVLFKQIVFNFGDIAYFFAGLLLSDYLLRRV